MCEGRKGGERKVGEEMEGKGKVTKGVRSGGKDKEME